MNIAEEYFYPNGAEVPQRVVDVLQSRARAGESIEDLAEDYGLPLETVRAMVRNVTQ